MLSAAISDRTFEPCSKKSDKPQFQCLDLADGQTQDWFELKQRTSHGASSTLNIGEFPSAASASSLSQILQKREDVPEKYFLSPRACKGILRRAKERGKELPPELKAALEAQASEQAHNHPPVVHDATVYVSGGFASFDEKPVAGSVRAAGGDRGGQRESCDTVGTLAARDFKGVGNQYVQEGKLVVQDD